VLSIHWRKRPSEPCRRGSSRARGRAGQPRPRVHPAWGWPGGQAPGHRQPVGAGQHIQPEPQNQRWWLCSSHSRQAGQRRALDRLAAGRARHRGRVDQPQLVPPARRPPGQGLDGQGNQGRGPASAMQSQSTSESTVRPSGPGWLCRLRRTPLVGQHQHHSGAAVGQCWWTWTSQSSGAVRQSPDRHLPVCGGAAGSCTVTRSPPAARGARVRVPSCAWVMLLTIARPRPTPPSSVRMRLLPR
jgi:hypothetical protein